MQNIEFSDVTITGGQWKTRQETNRTVTMPQVYERFCETHRFDALKCEWREGEPNMPHVFWDSDIAKWIEGAAYIIATGGCDEAEKIIEQAIDQIVENRDENGYFNSHYLVTDQSGRFTDRDQHELYCAGHLMEAAVAFYKATGKKRFLSAMCKYADYIERIFKNEKSAAFVTPGHPELELALMKLYEATGEKRYAELAKYFIDEHGKHPEEVPSYRNAEYNQDEMPIRDRTTAEGHCVRALYLMSGAADVAYEYGDKELKEACERFFENIVNRRMYITGGIGSTGYCEGFTVDYDLPTRTAYTETCAAISLALFANRMLKFGADSKYADIVEKTIYNGIVSGISLDGERFFYENPLEIDPDFNNVDTASKEKHHFPITQRVKIFNCSCCPPNILRFIASIGGLLYGFDDNTLYVHQYAASKINTNGIYAEVETDYPASGKIRIKYETEKEYLALRIPGWCKSFKINRDYTLKNGYAYIAAGGSRAVEIEFDMPVRQISANRRVHSVAGRTAVMRGPVVYCAEGIDNGPDLKSVYIASNAEFRVEESELLLPVLKTSGYRPLESQKLYAEACDDYEEIPLTLIPYYAFANRGETEMQVWLLSK